MGILFTFSIVYYFSVNWLMFAIGRFFIGKMQSFNPILTITFDI